MGLNPLCPIKSIRGEGVLFVDKAARQVGSVAHVAQIHCHGGPSGFKTSMGTWSAARLLDGHKKNHRGRRQRCQPVDNNAWVPVVIPGTPEQPSPNPPG